MRRGRPHKHLAESAFERSDTAFNEHEQMPKSAPPAHERDYEKFTRMFADTGEREDSAVQLAIDTFFDQNDELKFNLFVEHFLERVSARLMKYWSKLDRAKGLLRIAEGQEYLIADAEKFVKKYKDKWDEAYGAALGDDEDVPEEERNPKVLYREAFFARVKKVLHEAATDGTLAAFQDALCARLSRRASDDSYKMYGC